MVASHSSGKNSNPVNPSNLLDALQREHERLKTENSRLQQQIDELELSPYTKLGRAFVICSQYPEIFGDVDLHKFCPLFIETSDDENCTDDDTEKITCENDTNDDDEKDYDEAIRVCLVHDCEGECARGECKFRRKQEAEHNE